MNPKGDFLIMEHSLFVNHQLNYDEAVRRLAYWASIGGERGLSAIRSLAKVLERDRDCLYFETGVRP
jgi:hypothetical protein